MSIWENFISLNSDVEPKFNVLRPASEYLEVDARRAEWGELNFQEALKNDVYPLPEIKDREGYYGQDHFSYWASGLRDAEMLLEAARTYGVAVRSYLDLGCASGRVIRHFGVQYPHVRTLGCDINRLHVEWCNAFLPSNCMVFQNHSIPSIPLPDESLDLITAFSVFTHIETLETTWLMELMRLLRPGGLAWITVHTEKTLVDMAEGWPLFEATRAHPEGAKVLSEGRSFSGNRLVLRWKADASYSSNVFYKEEYIRSTWGRLVNIVDIRRRCPDFQDVVLIQKRK